MKANELRIGNLYLNNGVVDTVSVGLLGYLDQNNPIGVDPIPLTEEWLIKAGLEGKFITIGDDVHFEYDVKNNELIIGGPDACTYGQCFCAECKYVHQLQNLYFALTGEELTFKN